MLRDITIIAALGLSACSFSSPGGDGKGAPSLGEPELGDDPGAPPDGDAPDGDVPDGDMPDGDTGDDAADAGDTDPTGTGDDAEPPGDQPLPPPSDPPAGDDDGDPDEDDGAGTDDAGAVDCDVGLVGVLWAEDAELSSPMLFAEASEAQGKPLVAMSTEAESGEVTFELDLPCAGDYYVFGLVWDFMPGAWQNPDPDSFYIDVGAPELAWRYGCQTATAANGLSWQALERLDAQPCQTTPIVLQAPAPGTYPLTLRNREPGSGSMVAGIAALAVSTDPAFDPYDEYDPY